jgi:hypothetical protein
VGAIDRTHSAGPEKSLQFIPAEVGAVFEGQG